MRTHYICHAFHTLLNKLTPALLTKQNKCMPRAIHTGFNESERVQKAELALHYALPSTVFCLILCIPHSNYMQSIHEKRC